MSASEFLLWSHVLFWWAAANYVVRDPLRDDADPAEIRESWKWRGWVAARVLIAAAAVAYCALPNISLAIVILLPGVVLPLLRVSLPTTQSVELEVAANVLVPIGTFFLIRHQHAYVRRVFFTLPASDKHIAVALIVAALLMFVIHGGTYIVRGLLKKSGAVPKTTPADEKPKVDVEEYNRGRLIGALERALLFVVVIAGSYEAIGFIIAAKGLIRSKELESNRDMTEYFLIGSLASVLVALSCGILAKILITTWW